MDTQLNTFLDAWHLASPTAVADTGLATVWKVICADGTNAALKLYQRGDRGNEDAGSRLLTAWKDRGAVRILAEAETAILMDWLEGPSLGDIARSGHADEAVKHLAETARRLHQTPRTVVEGLRPLHDVFVPLLSCAFSESCAAPLRQDMGLAGALAQDLLGSQPAHVPLHGDLHPDNVILTGAGARVIDAKGYIGDPAFELANALRHPKGMPDLVRQPDQVDRALTAYATAMDVSRQRLARWAAAKCALSVCWRSDGALKDDPEADLLHLLLRAADQ